MGKDHQEIMQLVGAKWIADRIGKSQQSISEAGHRALNPNYRGEMIRPDAIDDTGRPLWLLEVAEEYIKGKPIRLKGE